MNRGSVNLVDIVIADDPELAPVLSGTHLPTSEGWKAELAQWSEEVGIAPIEKEATRIDKKKKKSRKTYLTDDDFLIG